VESGRKKGRIKNLQNERTLYDSIALGLAVYPMVFPLGWYFLFLTAPMTFYVALRHWKAPLGLVRRSRWRFILAMILAGLQIVGWIALVYYLVVSIRSDG
jgi:hypothetical protein